jgi:cytoskeleton-associated protein 5
MKLTRDYRADARINTWITATGSFFQSYLKRALSNLAAEEADRNASGVPGSPPSSRPMSVFPSAPSSPKVDGNLHLDHTDASKSPSSRLAKTASRVTSGTANDPRLDSLKQMFGVRETR